MITDEYDVFFLLRNGFNISRVNQLQTTPWLSQN